MSDLNNDFNTAKNKIKAFDVLCSKCERAHTRTQIAYAYMHH